MPVRMIFRLRIREEVVALTSRSIRANLSASSKEDVTKITARRRI